MKTDWDNGDIPYMEVESNVVIRKLFGGTRNREPKFYEPHLDSFVYDHISNKITTE